MAHRSPSDTHSPRMQSSTFQWPLPSSPTRSSPSSSMTVKEILDRYSEDPDILKHILMAKVEEDKKQTAKDVLKTEHARIHLKQLDMEILRWTQSGYPPQQQPYPSRVMPTNGAGDPSLMPKINAPPPPIVTQHTHHAPPSPVVYPHSAHPLCPPTAPSAASANAKPTSWASSHPPQYRMQPIHPTTSNTNDDVSQKRSRASISNGEEDRLSHDKVMEALKAKIQRGASIQSKRLPSLPKPPSPPSVSYSGDHHHHWYPPSSSTSSPRSAKPVLPPIDTTVGRLDSVSSMITPASQQGSCISSSSQPTQSLTAITSPTPNGSRIPNERHTHSPPSAVIHFKEEPDTATPSATTTAEA
ncbi:uncharacterized protein BYT42DRAFT_226432 [Radiomyces spectabilis]|uniref:uncharacterized protein n=1 Tax=Radiomyces spectabilis TaxID=64574 RepID=UPI00221F3C71|nr:uncharacterized protein BYT42DRAFT_226432 [Radiomyces spectabilis]KAI8388210.1 hypothetical protein BYT42DRAFT_226432 [Radiomyces spectabilis]